MLMTTESPYNSSSHTNHQQQVRLKNRISQYMIDMMISSWMCPFDLGFNKRCMKNEPQMSMYVEHMACCLCHVLILSIVCPPICYLILFPLLHLSPSLPTRLSPYLSLLVSCSPVLIRCLLSFVCYVNCTTVPSHACLLFPFGVVLLSLFNFVIKT